MRALLIKGLLHLFALLPIRTVHSMATWLGQFLAQHPKFRITQVTRTNIRLCFPHLSNEAQENLVKQSLIETCKAFSELGALWLWRIERVLGLVREVSGEECVQQALEQGKGAILLTPHFGAWELAGLYVLLRYQLTALYRPPKLSGLHDLVSTARGRVGGRMMPTDQSGVRALYKTLRQGKAVGLLPDQVPPDEESGVFAPFFGIPTYTMILVSRLARKTGAKVIFSYVKRLPQGQGFHVHFFPAPVDIAADNLAVACAALNQGVEHCVQSCPEQYQWSYKRFKRRPIGMISVY